MLFTRTLGWVTKTGTRGERSRPNHRKQRNGGDYLGAVHAVGVACARWAWRQRENCSVKSFFRKNQRINAKSEPSKCSRLAISRRRQSYAMIGVELRTPGRFSSNLEDGSAHLHTSRIVVKMRLWSRRKETVSLWCKKNYGGGCKRSRKANKVGSDIAEWMGFFYCLQSAPENPEATESITGISLYK